jgi:rhodanese-related sulfurtransferase
MKNIAPKDLSARLTTDSEKPQLIDVREPWEFAICHIPGSRSIPMRQIPQEIAKLDLEQETVVICHHGVRSLQVGLYLERMGHRQVINLQGGVAAWAEQVDPQMPTY